MSRTSSTARHGFVVCIFPVFLSVACGGRGCKGNEPAAETGAGGDERVVPAVRRGSGVPDRHRHETGECSRAAPPPGTPRPGASGCRADSECREGGAWGRCEGNG